MAVGWLCVYSGSPCGAVEGPVWGRMGQAPAPVCDGCELTFPAELLLAWEVLPTSMGVQKPERGVGTWHGPPPSPGPAGFGVVPQTAEVTGCVHQVAMAWGPCPASPGSELGSGAWSPGRGVR